MKIVDFTKYVLPDVPGCPTAVAKQAILDTAIEFLTESQAWDEVQAPQDLSDGDQQYYLDAPTGALCIDIKAVYLRVGELRGVSMEMLARVMPEWQTAEGSTPQLYTRALDFSSISVYPLPRNPSGETFRIHGVYTLTDSATTIPDDIVTRYREAIAHGAKYRLMVMPKADWQDLKLAQFHKSAYEEGKQTARITSIHGKTAGSVSARPRRFGQ